MPSNAGNTRSQGVVLGEFEQYLSSAVDAAWQVSAIANEFTSAEMQGPFEAQLKLLLSSLQDMERVSREVDIKIPMKAIELVDQGEDPSKLNHELLEQCRANNDRIRGKLYTLEHMEARLRHGLNDWNASDPISD